MTSYLDQSTYRSRWLVIFTYGFPVKQVKITDSDAAVSSRRLGDFASAPGLEIELPESRSDLRDSPLKIVVEESISSLFTALVAGVAAPVEVQVWEETLQSTSDADPERFLHFRGQISRATKNYNGRRGIIRFEVLGVKAMLEGALGMPCNSQCIWQLADQNCDALLVDMETVVVLAIDRRSFSVGGGHSLPDANFWERGWAEYDGLRIGIRKWTSSDANNFYLVDKPPAAWVGESVTIFPGCDKTVETCRSRWDNEDNFGGFGYSIPAYHPNFESPSL